MCLRCVFLVSSSSEGDDIALGPRVRPHVPARANAGTSIWIVLYWWRPWTEPICIFQVTAMELGETKLFEMAIELATRLPAEVLDIVARAIEESPSACAPTARTRISQDVPHPYYRDIAADFLDRWRGFAPDLPSRQAATILRGGAGRTSPSEKASRGIGVDRASGRCRAISPYRAGDFAGFGFRTAADHLGQLRRLQDSADWAGPCCRSPSRRTDQRGRGNAPSH